MHFYCEYRCRSTLNHLYAKIIYRYIRLCMLGIRDSRPTNKISCKQQSQYKGLDTLPYISCGDLFIFAEWYNTWHHTDGYADLNGGIFQVRWYVPQCWTHHQTWNWISGVTSWLTAHRKFSLGHLMKYTAVCRGLIMCYTPFYST